MSIQRVNLDTGWVTAVAAFDGIPAFNRSHFRLVLESSQNGPTIGFYIADLVQFGAEFLGDIQIRYKNKIMVFTGFFFLLINIADFGDQYKTNCAAAGLRDLRIALAGQLVFQFKQTRFGRNQFA